MASAMQGLRMAVQECQNQFRRNRWNCSTLISGKKHGIHSSIIFSKGYRESAFVHAIASAGISHAVARSCSMGKLMSCTCGRTLNNDLPDGIMEEQMVTSLSNGVRQQHSSWLWSGCSHNIEFGIHFSKLLLDERETAKDIHSKINIHNNRVGRRVVTNNMEIKCKCHGMSGSCELKTCWKATRNFRRVGIVLKSKYREAMLVDYTNSGHRSRLRLAVPRFISNEAKQKKQRRPHMTDLVYLERSPNFCEPNPLVESRGTKERICNKTSIETDNCQYLCCGKGYNIIRQRRVEKCHCRFRWCCHVTCKECIYEEWVTVCK